MATTTHLHLSDRALDVRAIYRALRLPRTIEEKMIRLLRQGKISKWFSAWGQEAISVGAVLALQDRDMLFPAHRNLGVWTARGVPLKPLFCQLMGKEGGFTHGRDRTFHFGLPSHRIIGMISHMAAMLPVGCGSGLAAQLRKEDWIAVTFCGEGASREGDFHEALSLAGVWKLPVVFIVENNQYALSTPVEEELPQPDVAAAGPGYGMPGIIVDGNDVLKVIEAVHEAAQHARSGKGAVLLEMKTFRVRGHEEASGTAYVPQELIDSWQERDPIKRYREWLLTEGLATEEELNAIDEALRREVDEAAAYALEQPEVTSTVERERADLFAPTPPLQTTVPERSHTMRYIDAVSEGLRLAMEADEDVLIMGQDVAEYGGVFKVTKGFVEAFGKERVRNTPIIESGVVGAAMGLALEGFKPVVEIQYADFLTCAFNQIVNNLATTHYRWGGAINVTIRAPYGGNIGAGPFHSRSPEAWFCHAPGLKVVVPGTPADAKGLLLTAIADPNPVLFFEHKYLYRALRGDVPEGWYQIPFGQARMDREGTDVTLVTYGLGLLWAREEAAYWEEQGVSVEIIDLRTLVPWDRETILHSLQKTNRLLVLHEATRTAGFGAEVAAEIAEEGFIYLDAPPVRVASEDLPVPFSIRLEREIFSAQSKLRQAMERLLTF